MYENQYDARMDSLMSDQESEKVEIYISAFNINLQTLAVETYLQEGNKQKRSIYRSKPTNVNGQRTDFANSIVIDYFFQYRQKLFFQIFDASSSRHISIGRVQSTVGQIFNYRDKGVSKQVTNNGKNMGELHLKCQKVDRGSQRILEFNIAARNLDVGSSFLCFGEGRSHYKLFKIKKNQEFMLQQSKVFPGKNNRFGHINIRESKLCNNNPKQPIVIRFYHDDGNSIIGQSYFDLQTLMEGKHRMTLTKGGKEKGIVVLENFKQTTKYDFTDFLSAGMQMAMITCIDFTASNGIQSAPTSLHNFSAHKRSQYEQALHEVSAIVLDYDTDKLVPCFGFGAKVNMPTFTSYNKVHHCFPLNGSQTNPNLFQLTGIQQGYRNCIPYLQFSGPTFFAPLLREAMKVCENMRAQTKQYMILLILTDGVIHDKEEVKDLLVKCGRLPLSIIIIGIGNGDDWKIMHQLDDDDMQMTDFQGNKSVRDLVQFVEFQKHNNNGVQLAREVLEQLPRQVVEYHQLNNLTPQAYQRNMMGSMVQERNVMY